MKKNVIVGLLLCLMAVLSTNGTQCRNLKTKTKCRSLCFCGWCHDAGNTGCRDRVELDQCVKITSRPHKCAPLKVFWELFEGIVVVSFVIVCGGLVVVFLLVVAGATVQCIGQRCSLGLCDRIITRVLRCKKQGVGEPLLGEL